MSSLCFAKLFDILTHLTPFANLYAHAKIKFPKFQKDRYYLKTYHISFALKSSEVSFDIELGVVYFRDFIISAL